jgi:hypothetical protein
VGRQLSFFSAAASAPTPRDVEGLLAGAAQLACRPHAARLSIRLADAWRAQALAELLAERGLDPETADLPDGSILLRTGFNGPLAALAARWTTGAVKRPPEGFVLDGARLRWWCLAGGSWSADGYRLVLGRTDQAAWPGVGAALARAGLPAAFVVGRPGPPVYRVSGAARLRRLAELVGDRPAGAPPGAGPDERAGSPKLTTGPGHVHTPPAP